MLPGWCTRLDCRRQLRLRLQLDLGIDANRAAEERERDGGGRQLQQRGQFTREVRLAALSEVLQLTAQQKCRVKLWPCLGLRVPCLLGAPSRRGLSHFFCEHGRERQVRQQAS